MENAEKIESTPQTADDVSHLISAVKEMKENHVSRDAYEKMMERNDELMERNKALVDCIINGSERPAIEEMKKQPEGRSLSELRRIACSREGNIMNLEWATAVKELNDKVVASGGQSIVLPQGRGVAITETERAQGKQFLDVLEYCINEAQGDEDTFQVLFNRCLAPDPIRPSRHK